MRVAACMSAQNVANTVWALATLGWQAEQGAMRCALEGAAVRVAPSINAQDVANVLWALATLGWQAEERAMRCALEGAAVRVAPSMSAQNVANTVWALATLGWQAGEGAMRGVLEGAAVWVAPSMNTQAVANTVWVLATLGWQADVELAVILQHQVAASFDSRGPSERSSSCLSHLLQAHLASQFLGLNLITLPSSTLEVAVRSWNGALRSSSTARRTLPEIHWSRSATPACAIVCCRRWGGALYQFPSSSGTGYAGRSRWTPMWSIEFTKRGCTPTRKHKHVGIFTCSRVVRSATRCSHAAAPGGGR